MSCLCTTKLDVDHYVLVVYQKLAFNLFFFKENVRYLVWICRDRFL